MKRIAVCSLIVAVALIGITAGCSNSPSQSYSQKYPGNATARLLDNPAPMSQSVIDQIAGKYVSGQNTQDYIVLNQGLTFTMLSDFNDSGRGIVRTQIGGKWSYGVPLNPVSNLSPNALRIFLTANNGAIYLVYLYWQNNQIVSGDSPPQVDYTKSGFPLVLPNQKFWNKQ